MCFEAGGLDGACSEASGELLSDCLVASVCLSGALSLPEVDFRDPSRSRSHAPELQSSNPSPSALNVVLIVRMMISSRVTRDATGRSAQLQSSMHFSATDKHCLRQSAAPSEDLSPQGARHVPKFATQSRGHWPAVEPVVTVPAQVVWQVRRSSPDLVSQVS